VQAAVTLGATTRVEVGTNVALAFPRSPTTMANDAWDLQLAFGDRFSLGLGSQVRRLIVDRYSASFSHPAKRMGEYMQAMRAVWAMKSGVRARFQGDIYRVVHPGASGYGTEDPSHTPRTLVGAVGPLMIRSATAHADGLLGHTFTSERYLTDYLLPRVEEGLRFADRERNTFSVNQGVIVSMSDDAERAVHDAKLQIGFYGTTRNYRGVFDSHGDAHLTDELHAVFKRDPTDHDALVEAVPDSAVDRYAIVGDPDHVRTKLERLSTLVDHVIIGVPWFGQSADQQRESLRRILATTVTPAQA
jgi:probable F420-dependent oxidoreductase